MRFRRVAGPLLVAMALLGACGGDDDDRDDDDGDAATSSTTEATGSTTTLYTAPANVFAKLVVQVDDHLRMLEQRAAPCMDGDRARCVGEALDAFNLMDDDAGALGFFLRTAIARDEATYVGELPDELVGLFDASQNVSAQTQAKIEAAQAACLPDFGEGCAEAVDAMDAALDEIYKNMNEWRRLL